MDQLAATALNELASNLTALVVKGTASAVSTKIRAIRVEKNIEAIKNGYDEIVNELISEREEAIRIAQVYKSEIDRYQISDEDIDHLHSTVERVPEIIRSLSPNIDLESYSQLKELISIDSLKAIQLIGFNYKRAIGEPLTELCASRISSFAGKKGPHVPNGKR
jgi:hypothetical protein